MCTPLHMGNRRREAGFRVEGKKQILNGYREAKKIETTKKRKRTEGNTLSVIYRAG